ncbi:hypothetical protein [Streptomyces sp. XD-27]|uniref:hypothetical protein n=1 Tax=Streptomyces sp. XD-27 TaxID=3062779 RepID=UPI0026F431CF|nr:hypothetical protein [Streptomyces sp. XD-27]WKX70323.1 hypothetical protein Q3Y56_10695 [Streptomyces sp. XD-27]
MIISVSLVLLMGIWAALLIRRGSLRLGGALVSAVFGFLLASSEMAPGVNDILTHLAREIADIDL